MFEESVRNRKKIIRATKFFYFNNEIKGWRGIEKKEEG